MKKFFMLMAAMMLTFNVAMMADDNRVITYDQLPQTAKTLLSQHFAKKVPLVVTMDWDEYEILYQSGEKVEFNKRGEWKSIDCRVSAVPSVLIPEQIKSHIKATFPGTTIIKLERDRRGYGVKLNNGLEVEYNTRFQVVEIDD
ncbi:MAG: PepSY-like domain-containing protein [Bacteroidaceae bacterium]|nr:PepSY-like domain-containing protein [Bacteroidaceae bacterium]